MSGKRHYLVRQGGRAEHMDNCDGREAYRKETERRLEEARTRREAEEKEKASQRYTRKEHKCVLPLACLIF